MINFPITFDGVVNKDVMLLKPNNSPHSHDQKAEVREDIKVYLPGAALQVPTTPQYQQAVPVTSPHKPFFGQG